MNTHSLFCSTLAISLLFGARTANAACELKGARPTETLPTTDRGQQFTFIATDDCPEQLRFEVRGTNFVKIPKAGPDLGSKDRTYKVVLTDSEWDSLMRESFALTFHWTIKTKATTGVDAEVVTTNELDADRDGWTRSEGDVRACDFSAGRNPGLEEICDGIDQDCDGLIDDGVAWFRDADGDGYGDDADKRCTFAEGYVDVGGDCDDSDPELWCAMFDLSLADAKLVGEASDDFAGFSVSGAGDVDGDGHDDLLVGAPSNADYRGAAYLVLGPVTGTLDLSLAHAKLLGEHIGDTAGEKGGVSGAGDVDGDGHDDLLVGAPYNNEAAHYAGAAYLVLGPVTGTLDLASADAKLLGEDTWDLAGQSVSAAGDVDGDGHADLLIGAPGNAERAQPTGAAYVVLGPATGAIDLSLADAKLFGDALHGEAGQSVSGAGDVDGNGHDDLLIGAPFKDDGAAYLVLGPVSGTVDLAEADAMFVADEQFVWTGYAVSGAGDVDGDGHGDLLIGAPYDNGGSYTAGAAYLVLGPVTGTFDLALADATFVGEESTGFSVSGAGDVDGDGHVDLLIGAYSSELDGQASGAAHLVMGPVTGILDLSLADATLVGERLDGAGFSVSGAGDVDADGLDDLLVGAPGNDEGGSDAGAAYLVYGANLF